MPLCPKHTLVPLLMLAPSSYAVHMLGQGIFTFPLSTAKLLAPSFPSCTCALLLLLPTEQPPSRCSEPDLCLAVQHKAPSKIFLQPGAEQDGVTRSGKQSSKPALLLKNRHVAPSFLSQPGAAKHVLYPSSGCIKALDEIHSYKSLCEMPLTLSLWGEASPVPQTHPREGWSQHNKSRKPDGW